MSRRNQTAFAEFALARSAALHRAAYLMVGDQQLAQDLVQEALTKTYVAWPRLRDPGKAEAYTRKAITTTAISWFRRKGWDNERPTDALPEGGSPGHADAVADRTAIWAGAAGTAAAAARGAGAALLRGPDRGADRRGDGLCRGHGEEPGLRRPRQPPTTAG